MGTQLAGARDTGWQRLAVRVPGQVLVFWLLTAVLLLLIAPPLAAMIYTSLRPVGELTSPYLLTLSHYATLARVFMTGGPFLNSLVYALGTSFAAVVLGGLLAWIAVRTNTPLRALAYLTCFSVLAIPNIVYTVAWVMLFGRGGPVSQLLYFVGLGQVQPNIFTLSGLVFVEALSWVPLAFLIVASSLRMLDATLEESAQVSGASLWQTVRRISIPLAMPSMLATVMLVFIRTIEAFAAPAVVGLPGKITVLTTEVYLAVTSFPPNYSLASAYGTTLIVLVAGFLYLYMRFTMHAQQFQSVTGKGYRPRVVDLRNFKYITTVIVLLYVCILVVFPFAMLLWVSLQPFYANPSVAALSRVTLENYSALLTYPKIATSVVNSVFIATASATLVLGLMLIAAWFIIRTTLPFRRLLDLLVSVPLVIPGIVLGVAMLRLYVNIPLPIYDTLAILLIAYIARFLPYGMRYCHAGLLQIHHELEEAAALSGATRIETFRRVILPLLWPTLGAGWVFIFLLAVKELAASVLLVGPRTPVIAVALFELWHDGQVTQLAAFSILLFLLFGSITIAMYSLAARRGLAAI